MIHTLVPTVQPIVAQQLDRCSLYRLAASHRNLRHILCDPRSYVFNSTYRPRYVGELNDDLQSIGSLPSTEASTTSTAFPPHLISQAARKMYMSLVRSVDLRYCCQDLVLAPEVPMLLSIVKNATELSLQGHWTYRLQEDDNFPTYYADKQTPLRELLLQLPLRALYINGPVWEKEACIVTELHHLVCFNVNRQRGWAIMFPDDNFHKYPLLTSANLTDKAFNMISQHSAGDVWFPSLRSLHLSGGPNDASAAAVSMLSLTLLHLAVPRFEPERDNIKLLLTPNTPMSGSLTTLEVSNCPCDIDIFQLALGFPYLTCLRVHFWDDNHPSTTMMRDIIALSKANPRLRALDVTFPAVTLSPQLVDSYFPVELAHESSFIGDASWRFGRPEDSQDDSISTNLPFLHFPFFSSISTLELRNVTIDYIDGLKTSLNALHTVKLCRVVCSTTSVLHWLRSTAPNLRHLHLLVMKFSSSSLCTLFPDVLSLELQAVTFTDTDEAWLDNLARLPLRCIALGSVSSVSTFGQGDTIADLGSWIQSILLDTSLPSFFAALRYVLFIPQIYTDVTKVRDIVPLLPQICAVRPHLQFDIRDNMDPHFLLDYDQCMKFSN